MAIWPRGTIVPTATGFTVCSRHTPAFAYRLSWGLPEVPRVLFLGICLDFHYCLWQVLLPKFGFHLGWGSVSQALVEPYLVPP